MLSLLHHRPNPYSQLQKIFLFQYLHIFYIVALDNLFLQYTLANVLLPLDEYMYEIRDKMRKLLQGKMDQAEASRPNKIHFKLFICAGFGESNKGILWTPRIVLTLISSPWEYELRHRLRDQTFVSRKWHTFFDEL